MAMNVRTKMLLVVAAVIAVPMMLAAVALVGAVAYWAIKAPAVSATMPSSTPVVASNPLTSEEYLYEGAKYTRLSTTEPDGLPAVDPYGGLARSGQAAIPADTEPAIWSQDWQENLSGEQAKMYAQGLVRSGLDDLHLCKSGYTCHGTVNYRVYEQNRSDLPHIITLQMSFTTPTQHEELFLLVHNDQGKVWSMSAAGWNLLGVVEELPENDRTMVYELMASSHLDDMKY